MPLKLLRFFVIKFREIVLGQRFGKTVKMADKDAQGCQKESAAKKAIDTSK